MAEIIEITGNTNPNNSKWQPYQGEERTRRGISDKPRRQSGCGCHPDSGGGVVVLAGIGVCGAVKKRCRETSTEGKDTVTTSV